MCGSSSGVAEGQGVSVRGGGVITNQFVWQFFCGCRRTGGLCRGGGGSYYSPVCGAVTLGLHDGMILSVEQLAYSVLGVTYRDMEGESYTNDT